MKLFVFYLPTREPLVVKDQLMKGSGKRVFFDADKIICKNQVLVAIHRAERSEKHKKMVAKNWGIEVLLHLVGTHQISEALPIVNINENTKTICIIQKKSTPPHPDSISGFPVFTYSTELKRSYKLTSDDPCKEIISKGVTLIIDHE